MHRLLSLLFLVGLGTVSVTAEAKNTLLSSDLGISMEFPLMDTDSQDYSVATFFLPPDDHFSANVNVQKLTYEDSLEAYDRTSLAQFTQMRLTLLTHKITATDIKYEYKGQMRGRDLHWYARVVKAGQNLYLITATGLDKTWYLQKPVLMRSVDSFVPLP